MIFFPEIKTFFPKITYIEVFKSALWVKNSILIKFFHGKKGTLQPKKGHLPKLGGARPPLAPPVPTPLRLSAGYSFSETGTP
jgi:hypothetical protein